MPQNNKAKIIIVLQLLKVTVILPVSFLCFLGFLMFAGSVNSSVWTGCIGVFLLSGAASVLNQLMEQKYDALMDRTRLRPLPSGRCSPLFAKIVFFVSFIAGMSILLINSLLAAELGLLAIAWYIFVYTLLKRVTPFATVPGALTGALPLLIGWVVAGGSIYNEYILYVSLFVFVWQIPHFWLLMMLYGNDYERAGFPTLFRVFSERNLRLWTLGWIVAMSIIAMALPSFRIVEDPVRGWAIVGLSLSMIITASFLLLKKNPLVKKLFHVINLYMILVIAVLAIH